MHVRSSRRRWWVCAVAGVTGDFAVGFALASACAWVIQSAALGLFLSFLAWVLTALAALALSQRLVHPLVAFALSDAKLDRGLEVLASIAATARELGLGSALARYAARRT